MPGLVEDHMKDRASHAARHETEYLLRNQFAQWDMRDDGTRANYGERRTMARHIAHLQNQYIQYARENRIGQYADEAYRMGARHGVIDFSRDLNHGLKERERIAERQTQGPRMRI